MPLYDNSFSIDTEAERLERLRAIQENRATTLPLIAGIHSDVAAWMQNCHTVYEGLVQAAQANSNDARSHTVLRRVAKRTLRQELLIAKKQVLAGYANDDIRRSAFHVEQPLPLGSDDLIHLAEEFERLSTKHKAEGVGYHVSDLLIERLQAAATAMKEAQKLGTESQSEEDSAYAAGEVRYNADTLMLQRLRADWQAALGNDDPRIGLVGMVNSRRGGNSGRPGAPTLALNTQALQLTVVPDANRPAATSYQVEYRDTNDTGDWVELSNGAATSIALTDPVFGTGNGTIEFRARARNAHGFSDWSAVVGGL